MSVVSRGVRNTFRNGLRTSAVVVILAISIGLSLSMLVANKAVEGRIADLKTEVDRTVVINPAGGQGFEGGGEPLTADDLAKVKAVPGVQSASGFMDLTLQPEGDDQGGLFMSKGGAQAGKTNLVSSIDAGTLGQRFSGREGTPPADIKLPIRGMGTNSAYERSGKAFNLTSGRLLNDDDTYQALVGKSLAGKNNLSVGSTFTAYDKTFTVVGLIDQGTQFANDTIILPLKTAQEVTGLSNEVSAIVAEADSIDNLESVMSGIKKTLGEDKADVTSSQENIRQAIESLKSVQTISIIGFVTALAASALIVLMVMFVVVRERRREIGVLKAIGGSNRSIVSQFVVEAVVLVAMGGMLGLGTAFVGSGAIANALVSNSASTGSETETGPGMKINGGPAGVKSMVRLGGDSSKNAIQSTSDLVGKVSTSIGAATLAYGFLGMLVVAVLGSALPAWLIAKVRPAEVLRGE